MDKTLGTILARYKEIITIHDIPPGATLRIEICLLRTPDGYYIHLIDTTIEREGQADRHIYRHRILTRKQAWLEYRSMSVKLVTVNEAFPYSGKTAGGSADTLTRDHN